MAERQNALTNEICKLMMSHLDLGHVDLVQAAAAAYGACATILGVLSPADREAVAEVFAAGLLEQANRRAAEIAPILNHQDADRDA